MAVLAETDAAMATSVEAARTFYPEQTKQLQEDAADRNASGRPITVDELERIFDAEEYIPVVILRNGEIRSAFDDVDPAHVAMTYRECLGGEYGGQAPNEPKPTPNP